MDALVATTWLVQQAAVGPGSRPAPDAERALAAFQRSRGLEPSGMPPGRNGVPEAPALVSAP